MRYTARAGAVGADVLRYRLRLRDGRRYRGIVRIRILARHRANRRPGPAPRRRRLHRRHRPRPRRPTGSRRRCPPSPARSRRPPANWQPTAYDTCPAALHERFSVVGPDGAPLPDLAPAHGRRSGHRRGRARSATSTAPTRARPTCTCGRPAHFAAPGYEAYAGLPFGLAAEALDTWSDATATPRRSEDHVGYKVDVADDVALLGADGAALGVTCDHLTVVHQGSHSPDALSNNVHELLYAVRCDDGTELIADMISRFGDAGEYTRSCEPAVTVATTDNGYPGGRRRAADPRPHVRRARRARRRRARPPRSGRCTRSGAPRTR